MKKLLKKIIQRLGYKLTSLQEIPYINEFTTEKGLARFVERGGMINTVIDVGASDGRWSRTCIKYLPLSNYLLIEAQDPHIKNLEEIKNQFQNVDYIIAAAGNYEGEIFFNNEELFGGIASDKPFDDNCISVKVTTIDYQVEERKLIAPFLIKLDTHGFEVPILEGALKTIYNAGLIIIECYNYQITDKSLKYYQICKYMEEHGFSCIEVVDLMHREKDGTFWQMDIFFVPSNSVEFNYIKYK